MIKSGQVSVLEGMPNSTVGKTYREPTALHAVFEASFHGFMT